MGQKATIGTGMSLLNILSLYNCSRIQLSVAVTILFETDTIRVSSFVSCYRFRLPDSLPVEGGAVAVDPRDTG